MIMTGQTGYPVGVRQRVQEGRAAFISPLRLK